MLSNPGFSPTWVFPIPATPKNFTPLPRCRIPGSGGWRRACGRPRQAPEALRPVQGIKNSRLRPLPHEATPRPQVVSTQVHCCHRLTQSPSFAVSSTPPIPIHQPANLRWTSPESGANSSDPPTPSASNPSIPYSFTTTLENSRNRGVNSVPDLGILSKVAAWPVSRTATPQTDSGQGLAERPRIAPSTRNRWIRRCP